MTAAGALAATITIVTRRGAEPATVNRIVEQVNAAGGAAVVSRGASRTLVEVIGEVPELALMSLESAPGVAKVVRVATPYKLTSREVQPSRSTVPVTGVPIGPGRFTLIAGPCAVETPDQTLAAAVLAKRAGAVLLRAGAYKPRTSPYSFQGLGRPGLEILANVRDAVG
ncbi:MAG: hypothetical protein ACRDT2_05915, partial [Natronosporangium sp.]